MATTTKLPRPRSTHRPGTNGAPADPIAQARKIIAAAKRKASKLTADEQVNRSTRQRGAMKAKAEGFDELAGLFTGRR